MGNPYLLVAYYPQTNTDLSEEYLSDPPRVGDIYQVVDVLKARDERGEPFEYLELLWQDNRSVE